MLEAAGAGVRPLTTTAIADAAIEHVRGDPVLYYGIVAPVSIPLAALALYFSDLVTEYRGEPADYAPRVQLAAIAIALLVHARLVAHGALAWALERKLRGVEVTISEAWRAAARRTLPLALAGIVFWSVTMIGMFLAFIPSVLTFPLLVLGSTVAMIEERSAVGGIFRAVELGWRETGRALQLVLILALGGLFVVLGVGCGVIGLLELAKLVFYADTTYLETLAKGGDPLFRTGVACGTFVLMEPVQALVFALLYVDRRVRTEGFDLKRKVQLIVDAEMERRMKTDVASELARAPEPFDEHEPAGAARALAGGET